MSTQIFDVRRAAPRVVPTAIAAACLLVAAGCGSSDEPEPDDLATMQASLTLFDSCLELDEYLTDLTTDMLVDSAVYGYGYYDTVGAGRGAAEMDGGAGGAPTAPGASPDPSGFTGTNVQEAGVDEPDLVKTDGQTMYVVQESRLHIIDSWPAEETHEVATVDLRGWGEQIFLVGDRVVALTSVQTGPYPWSGGEGRPGVGPTPDEAGEQPDSGDSEEDPDPMDDGAWFSGTRATVIDVSDPSRPQVVETFDIEGHLVNARMVDGRVYLVISSNLFPYGDPALEEAGAGIEMPELAWDASMEERDRAAASLRAQVRPILAQYIADGGRDAFIPDLRTSARERSNLFRCDQIFRPEARAGLAVLSVVGFDAASPTPSGVGILADGWNIYGSQTSLYVAQDSRWWYWASPEDAATRTHIHKFGLGDGAPTYEASGEVEGWLLNQFSMSEHEGVLRVATTDQSNWGWGWGVGRPGGVIDSDGGTTDGGDSIVVDPVSPDSPPPDAGSSEPSPGEQKQVVDLRENDEVQANNVFTLRQDGRSLEIIGGIRGIAPTEQIYAVRFMGDRGYVVTFLQVDPLFTLDLSDPTSPQILGELHIPGYSGYLHPLGDDHLIGIGRDGDDTGVIGGFHVQVFDVSDPSTPTRSAHHVLETERGGWSWSEAEHDHHAFTFYESHGLLALPVTLQDSSWESDEYSHFSGVIVFRVTPTSIEEVGRVSHTAMAADRYCEARDTDDEAGRACASWDYPWWVQMRRSVFIDEYLYAISSFGVTVSAIDALSDVLADVRY